MQMHPRVRALRDRVSGEAERREHAMTRYKRNPARTSFSGKVSELIQRG